MRHSFLTYYHAQMNLSMWDDIHEILNDLLSINKERIMVYKRAINATHDMDIDVRISFENMISESVQYIQELNEKVWEYAQDMKGNMVAGKIYSAWKDVRATYIISHQNAVLSFCEFIEDATQRA